MVEEWGQRRGLARNLSVWDYGGKSMQDILLRISRLQALAHPSIFRLPIVGKLLPRASAKAFPHFLLLKLQERSKTSQCGTGLRNW